MPGGEDDNSHYVTALSLQGIGGDTVVAGLKAFINRAPSEVGREEAETLLGKLTE